MAKVEQWMLDAAAKQVTHMLQCRKPITQEAEHLAEIIAADAPVESEPPAQLYKADTLFAVYCDSNPEITPLGLFAVLFASNWAEHGIMWRNPRRSTRVDTDTK